MTKIALTQRLIAASLVAGSLLPFAGTASAVIFTPPGEGAPQRGEAASSRSGGVCSHGGQGTNAPAMVVPLLPQGNYGTTVAERPEILVYVPASQAKQALFSLKDKARDTRYQAVVPLSGDSEILTVRLPETAPALAEGETYTWYLALQCEGSIRPVSPVEGKIKRIAPSSNTALRSSAQPADIEALLDVASRYGAEGIWYDTVATLARLKSAQPADATIDRH